MAPLLYGRCAARTAGKGTLKLCELLQQCSTNDLLYGLAMKMNTTIGLVPIQGQLYMTRMQRTCSSFFRISALTCFGAEHSEESAVHG